jgi:calcium-dependent protein kinase
MGLAKEFKTKRIMRSKVGTSYYMAPEVLKGAYNEKCDCWSLGAILYLMLVGDVPYNSGTDAQIFKKIMTTEYDTTSNF